MDVTVGGHDFCDVSDDESSDEAEGGAAEDIGRVSLMDGFVVGDEAERFGEGCLCDDVETG